MCKKVVTALTKRIEKERENRKSYVIINGIKGIIPKKTTLRRMLEQGGLGRLL